MHALIFFSAQDDDDGAAGIPIDPEEEPRHAGAEDLDGEALEDAEMGVENPCRSLDEDISFMHC